jgi:hypothetical protein
VIFGTDAAKQSVPEEAMDAVTERTLFRSYTSHAFIETASWAQLRHILTGNGGAYGLYGPRGSGKSWLMRRASEWADEAGGVGLWFPCPSGYDTAAFLSGLSDNLANEIEQRYVRNDPWRAVIRWAQWALALAVAVPVITAVVAYAAHGLSGNRNAISSALPLGLRLWVAAGTALALICLLAVVQLVRANRPAGRLAREATALRERIRYSTALKQGSEAGITGAYHLTATFKRTREKALDERPTTVASLVFDFRRLAAAIVAATGKPLVIGIDELDKIDDPEAVRSLLRDIKGIFEVSAVFFLVSVSEEAAAALRLGALHGRDEFSSSFYTVIEMPPLDPAGVALLVGSRGRDLADAESTLLCLLSVGNWRDVIRLAESWDQVLGGPSGDLPALGERTRRILAAEAATLVREVVRAGGVASPGGLADPGAGPAAQVRQALAAAWRALPESAFGSERAFDELSRYAIRDHWDLFDPHHSWPDAPCEAWRRFLIRLFVVGRVLLDIGPFGEKGIADLRDVLIMAGHSSAVARLMLEVRFGEDLASPYGKQHGALLPMCLFRYRGVVFMRRGSERRSIVSTPGHEASDSGEVIAESGTAGEGRAGETGLLIISRLSLEDLAQLDDSVVADALRDLVERRRCGTGPGERYSLHDSTL